jgi:hypothetical protein
MSNVWSSAYHFIHYTIDNTLIWNICHVLYLFPYLRSLFNN